MSDLATLGLRIQSDEVDVAEKRLNDLEQTAGRTERATDSLSGGFGCFGTEWKTPSVFWFVGGTDPALYESARSEGRINELPVNHSPKFAPVLHPTLETGVEAMTAAALAWNAV